MNPFDLEHLPFATAGSYFAVTSAVNTEDAEKWVELRTVRGRAATRALLRIAPRCGLHGKAAFDIDHLVLPAAAGHVSVDFNTHRVLSVSGAGVGFDLIMEAASNYDTLVRVAEDEWRYLRFSSQVTIAIRVLRGRGLEESTWAGERHTMATLQFAPGSVVLIEETNDATPTARKPWSPPSFHVFAAGMPEVRPEHQAAKQLASYSMWSSMVEPSGAVQRPAMYMSKGTMTSVWSWDHCFNAISLARLPELAEDQFFVPFDAQATSGRLPDSVNDKVIDYTFTKPPIHGWALMALFRAGAVNDGWLLRAYDPLQRWTQWWLTERVASGRILPHYFHGNDSGWDNSTIFATTVPVESPDLAAFLVLQTEALSEIASQLSRQDEARNWAMVSSSLLNSLLEDMWDGSRFIARKLDSTVIESASLLHLLPIVLGSRLPPEVFATLVGDLGRFRTEYGLATEATDSPAFTADGYWRGPIWAPCTALIIDGLINGGEEQLALDLAERFCAMASTSGMAENFDAVTGAGLRDRAYTWTSSVFLNLAGLLAAAEGTNAAPSARHAAMVVRGSSTTPRTGRP